MRISYSHRVRPVACRRAARFVATVLPPTRSRLFPNSPREDLAAACTYFEMQANAHGLATCWCGFLQLAQREIPELLEKTSGIRRTTPFCAMLFGLPAVTYQRGVQRAEYANAVYA